MSAFSDRLRQLRAESDMTQKEISALLGLTLRTWENYENGKSEPGISNLCIIADGTGVSIDWLAGRTEKRSTRR